MLKGRLKLTIFHIVLFGTFLITDISSEIYQLYVKKAYEPGYLTGDGKEFDCRLTATFFAYTEISEGSQIILLMFFTYVSVKFI